ncbi:hypothetical protein Hanom_Chr02g00166971 [Helianthus anomalus]
MSSNLLLTSKPATCMYTQETHEHLQIINHKGLFKQKLKPTYGSKQTLESCTFCQ